MSECNLYAKKFNNEIPRQYLEMYCDKYGMPHDETRDSVYWYDVEEGHEIIQIKDEQIHHDWPVTHVDFIYSTRHYPKGADGKCSIKPDHVCALANSSGSIFVDQLTCTAQARCHKLIKNQVSLDFITATVNGDFDMDDARNEYARRIKANVTTSTFSDPFNEREETMGEGDHHVL